MAEIASVAVGRAIQARTDDRNLRRREERARQELVQARQAQVTRQAQAAEELAVARRLRTQTVDDEQRTRLADQKLFDAQRESQDIRFSDRQFEFLQAEITEETLRARALDNDTGPLPPLPPGEPAGTVLSADDIEARDRLNSVPETIPGPPPADDSRFAQGPAPLEASVGGVQPPDDGLQGAEAQAITGQLLFDVLEGERAVRLIDSRESDRDFQIQQRIDQGIAEDRVPETPFEPTLPRGSIVDISG